MIFQARGSTRRWTSKPTYTIVQSSQYGVQSSTRMTSFFCQNGKICAKKACQHCKGSIRSFTISRCKRRSMLGIVASLNSCKLISFTFKRKRLQHISLSQAHERDASWCMPPAELWNQDDA